MSEGELPAGWAVATIADLTGNSGLFTDGDWVETKDQDPSGTVRLVQLSDVGDGEFRDRSDRHMNRQRADEMNCTFLKPRDVLIARMPEPLGRACLVPEGIEPAVTSVDVCIVRPAVDIDTRWLQHAINSPDFRSAVSSLQSGSTRKRISRKNLATLSLNVPPAREQRRVADAVDAALSELAASCDSMATSIGKLAAYRAAVLGAACEGRLLPTEEMSYAPEYESGVERARRLRKGADRRRKGKPVDDVPSQTDAPPGWGVASLPALSWQFGYGTSAKCDYAFDGPAVLRIPNIQSGRITLDDIKKAGTPEVEADLAPADFLLVRTNGSRNLIGRGAMVEKSFVKPTGFASYLIRYRVDDPDAAQWISTIWPSPPIRRALESLSGSSAGQYNLGMNDIAQVVIPIPPIAEQRRIVAEVERRLSVVERLEASIEANLARAKRLRQAILKLAFEGKLVPQDPNDEPAAMLLERIRKEREAGAAVAKPRKKRVARA